MTIRTLALILGIAAAAAYAQPATPQFMVRLELQKPLTAGTMTASDRQTTAAHATYLWSLYVQGKLTLAARTGALDGFYLVQAADAQVAAELVKNDPLVQSGMAKGDVLPLRTMFDRGAELARRERRQIAVDPKTLSAYAGTYRVAPGFDLAIALEGDALTLTTAAMGNARVKLVPVAEGKFVFEAVDMRIDFERDEKGDVTQCILHDSARTLKGLRTATAQRS